ncbi:hypothetical protein SAMN04488105_1471, partial [Salipiger thiooxidans]
MGGVDDADHIFCAGHTEPLEVASGDISHCDYLYGGHGSYFTIEDVSTRT